MTAASVSSSKKVYAVLCTQMAAMPLFMAFRAHFAIRRSLCGPHRMRDSKASQSPHTSLAKYSGLYFFVELKSSIVICLPVYGGLIVV